MITSRFIDQVYDVSQGLVTAPPGSQRLMDAMRISDPVVTNCLIDQMHIETILLVEDSELANQLTREPQNAPQNLSKVICLKPFAEYFACPFRTYSLKARQHRYIQMNTAEVRQQHEYELEEEKRRLEEVDQQQKQHKRQLDQAKKNLREREGTLIELKTKLHGIESRITEINRYDYPMETEVDELQQDLVSLKRDIETIDRTLAEHRTQHDKAIQEAKFAEDRMKEIRTNRNAIQNQINQLQSKVDAERSRAYELVSNTKAREAQVVRLKNEAVSAQAESKAVDEKLKALVKEAEQLAPERVKVQHNNKELARLINELDARIKTLTERTDTVAEIEEKLKMAMLEEADLKSFVGSLSITLSTAHSCRKARYEMVSKIKRHMAMRVLHKFKNVLAVRKFQGDIEFNWREQTLKMNVIPRGQKATQTKTKSLSGGERSYSTVAFLIALWSCVNHPFYFLDEYDVFTDQVNRFVMTRLLIHEAQKKGDQYAFLTPQDMSAIKAADDLTIHRFADPIRC